MKERARLFRSHLPIGCVCPINDWTVHRIPFTHPTPNGVCSPLGSRRKQRGFDGTSGQLNYWARYRSNKAMPKAMSQTDHKI